ncbi:hypothetical protein LJB89_02325 [Tyzzerella sp. OttesenSCG-928-J15]|nr:hypothetical protein [Tyzzerella sp. OttesenSCG-928-J15]
MKKRRKLKRRYLIALGIVGISILATPFCVKAAYEFRGYEAFGGEYCIIPLGFMAAYIFTVAVNEIEAAVKKMQISARGERHDSNHRERHKQEEDFNTVRRGCEN